MNFDLVEKLTAFLETLATLGKAKRELADKALQATSEALTETHLYYRRLDETGERVRSEEDRLVRLWAAAAIPMRHFDQHLAEICQYKSEYWLNPSKWSEAKVREFNIGLSGVQELYRHKLREQSFANRRVE